MNYQETIDYLYSKLPMFSRIGEAAIKKDLTNTLTLCEALQNPQQQFKTIHIAGTNGKGSTSHMLAAVLQEAGYKTGLYTSPHLVDFRERIRVNGSMIPESFVIRFTENAMPLINRIEPSFFELTVAMAFSYFKEEQVDIAVIETGLGGRLDSTNIIQPELSIITNIGWDHMNLLGNTLPDIAKEKAGIIKENTPVVIGEYHAETFPVFEQTAGSRKAPLHLAASEWTLKDTRPEYNHLTVDLEHVPSGKSHQYALDLPGIYQTHNLKTVLSAVRLLNQQGWTVNESALLNGLAAVKKNTGLKGRWDILQREPWVIADVGHNTDGIKQVLSQLSTMTYRNLHWVIGMVKDKEIEKVLQLLPTTARYYFTRSAIPRALSETDLQSTAASFGLKGDYYSNVNLALESAMKNAGKEDLILICGSVFLVGELPHYTSS